MWKPGFEVLERQKATLFGLHRSLCVYSWVHRGTKQNPGLVLGLDRGGSCKGIALRAPGKRRDEIIEYLRQRELVTRVYLECWWHVELENGERAPALVYRADQTHEQYAPGLSIDQQISIVRNGRGGSGANPDYLASTVQHLRESSIHDPALERIATAIGEKN